MLLIESEFQNYQTDLFFIWIKQNSRKCRVLLFYDFCVKIVTACTDCLVSLPVPEFFSDALQLKAHL
jgi:hypothetical protein